MKTNQKKMEKNGEKLECKQDNEEEKIVTTETPEKIERTEIPEKYENKAKEG